MPTVTLTLIRQSSISNSSELFSYTTMYSNFVFLDRFLFELSCKNTHKHGHTHTHTCTHTQIDSNEYPIVAFSKNATIRSETIIVTNYCNHRPIYMKSPSRNCVGEARKWRHAVRIQLAIILVFT